MTRHFVKFSSFRERTPLKHGIDFLHIQFGILGLHHSFNLCMCTYVYVGVRRWFWKGFSRTVAKVAASVTPMNSCEPFDEAVGIFAGLKDSCEHIEGWSSLTGQAMWRWLCHTLSIYLYIYIYIRTSIIIDICCLVFFSLYSAFWHTIIRNPGWGHASASKCRIWQPTQPADAHNWAVLVCCDAQFSKCKCSKLVAFLEGVIAGIRLAIQPGWNEQGLDMSVHVWVRQDIKKCVHFSSFGLAQCQTWIRPSLASG